MPKKLKARVRKTQQVHVLVSPEERDRIEELAKKANMEFSQYLRQSALQKISLMNGNFIIINN